MKKLYLIFFSVFAVAALTALNNPPAFGGFSSEKTVYVGSASSQARFAEFDAEQIVNGATGESCRISAENFDLEKVVAIFGARTVGVERIGNTVSYYLFSPELKRCVTVGGKKVNLHIAVNDEFVTMGTPLIFGAY